MKKKEIINFPKVAHLFLIPVKHKRSSLWQVFEYMTAIIKSKDNFILAVICQSFFLKCDTFLRRPQCGQLLQGTQVKLMLKSVCPNCPQVPWNHLISLTMGQLDLPLEKSSAIHCSLA